MEMHASQLVGWGAFPKTAVFWQALANVIRDAVL